VTKALAAHIEKYGEGDDRLIFSNGLGGALRRTRFSDVWRPAAKSVGPEPGTGFHALRHFYASALIRYGESVKVVQARLGHASASETLDTYSHLWPDSEDRTRAAIEDAFAPDTAARAEVV
jgi:integrase